MGKNWCRKWYFNKVLMLMGFLLIFCFGIPVQAEETQGISNAKGFTDENLFEINMATGFITKYNEPDVNNPQREIVIPAMIGGISVRGLDGTFKENTAIERVIVPDTITTIGDNTFNGCTSFVAMCVYNPAEGKSVSDLLAGASYLDGSKYIVTADKLTAYEIVDKGSCVVISKNVTAIGQNVFNACSFSCFEVLEGNTSFCDSNEGGMNLQEGVGACLMSYDKKILYRLAPGFRDSNNSLQYTLPVGIEEIYPYAIHKTNLQEVTVSTSVKQIDEYAFYDSNLLKVTFAETSLVETIGQWAFAYNANMDITLPASVKTIGSYCLAYITNRTPDISKTQITTLPAYVFQGCPNLHTITMPATLLVIEAYAFAGSDNLNEVIFLGDRLEKIEEGAFKDCQNLHSIDIPEGVTAIENDTFSGCQNLNVIKLPDSLTTIGDNAFANCQNIHEMVIPPNVTYMSNTTFDGVEPEKLVNIDTSKNAYAQTKVKKPLPKKGTTQIIGNLKYKVTKSNAKTGTVTVVSAKDKKQKSVTIPATVNINGYDFKVTAIAGSAFKANTKLTKVVIGTNVKTIGTKAFYGCKKLKTITVKSKVVTKVNKNAFKGIYKKAKIKLPKMSSKKFKKYKKKFANKGQASTVKITK